MGFWLILTSKCNERESDLEFPREVIDQKGIFAMKTCDFGKAKLEVIEVGKSPVRIRWVGDAEGRMTIKMSTAFRDVSNVF